MYQNFILSISCEACANLEIVKIIETIFLLLEIIPDNRREAINVIRLPSGMHGVWPGI